MNEMINQVKEQVTCVEDKKLTHSSTISQLKIKSTDKVMWDNVTKQYTIKRVKVNDEKKKQAIKGVVKKISTGENSRMKEREDEKKSLKDRL